MLGPFATDHFYPLARTCASDPYRCPTIERLLSQERMDNFDYEVYTHATEAARRGLRYRMDETNTAAGRGAAGVSDVAASATWTLDTLFQRRLPAAARPARSQRRLPPRRHRRQRPQRRSADAYFFPQEGNAVLQRDPLRPHRRWARRRRAAVLRLLLFARLAQGTTGCDPAALDPAVRAWGCGPHARSDASS